MNLPSCTQQERHGDHANLLSYITGISLEWLGPALQALAYLAAAVDKSGQVVAAVVHMIPGDLKEHYRARPRLAQLKFDLRNPGPVL